MVTEDKDKQYVKKKEKKEIEEYRKYKIPRKRERAEKR